MHIGFEPLVEYHAQDLDVCVVYLSAFHGEASVVRPCTCSGEIDKGCLVRSESSALEISVVVLLVVVYVFWSLDWDAAPAAGAAGGVSGCVVDDAAGADGGVVGVVATNLAAASAFTQ